LSYGAKCLPLNGVAEANEGFKTSLLASANPSLGI